MLYPQVDLEILPEAGPILIAHPHALHRLGADAMARATLRFGDARSEVEIQIDAERPRTRVSLGAEIAQAMHIPAGLPWELARAGHELILGPFIGILRFPTADGFNLQTLALLKDRAMTYAQLRGALFAFAADQLPRRDGLMDGFLYDPAQEAFVPATLPTPAAVFRLVPLRPEDRDRLLERVGGAVFNDYHPDKWEVYRWLVGDRDLALHLPLMRWFNHFDEVAEITGDNGQVVLRPLAEAESWATVLIQRRDGGWLWRRRVHREWVTESVDAAAIEGLVRTHLEGRPSLIQQWPFPMREGDRWTDVHVRVQKGQAAQWQVTGMIARRSGLGGPVANLSAGGIAAEADASLREALRLDEPGLYLLKQRIFDLALRVGDRLDRCGVLLGDLAVDVGIDLDRKVWIHNVNARIPDPTVGLDVGDTLLFYRLVTEPLFFAKALAGFPTPVG